MTERISEEAKAKMRDVSPNPPIKVRAGAAKPSSDDPYAPLEKKYKHVSLIRKLMPDRVPKHRTARTPYKALIELRGEWDGDWIKSAVIDWFHYNWDLVEANHIKNIMFHNTHGSHADDNDVDLSDDLATTSNGYMLNVYNWCVPTELDGIRSSTMREFNTGAGIITIRDGNSDGFTLGVEVREIAERKEYTIIRDESGGVFALYRDLSLYILFDMNHGNMTLTNNYKILDYILSKLFAELKLQEPSTITRRSPLAIDLDSVRKKFAETYNEFRKNQVSEDVAARHRSKIVDAWSKYISLLRAYGDYMRTFKSSREFTEEQIAADADRMVKSIVDNPFVSSVNINRVGNLRIITKSIPSKFYDGMKKIIVEIPIMMVNSGSRIVTIRELSDIGIRPLRSVDGYIYDDNHICLGTMAHTIAGNMLAGTWDIAVMMVIRGLMGNDRAFKKWMRYYSMKEPDEKLFTELERECGSIRTKNYDDEDEDEELDEDYEGEEDDE